MCILVYIYPCNHIMFVYYFEYTCIPTNQSYSILCL